MKPAYAYQVPCPKCEARKGDRCKDMRSPDWHFQLDSPKRAHRERIEVARAELTRLQDGAAIERERGLP